MTILAFAAGTQLFRLAAAGELDVVAEPAGVPVRVPVRRFQRCRGDLSVPADARAGLLVSRSGLFKVDEE